VEIREETKDEALVIAPVGRVDSVSSGELERHIVSRLDAGTRRLVIDLGGVEYISSAGLRVLMLANKQAKAQGGTLVVAALQPIVKEIFEISRFTVVFEVFSSVRDAVARLSPAALAALDRAST
jgi:anti-anti-sigma factor